MAAAKAVTAYVAANPEPHPDAEYYEPMEGSPEELSSGK
jgi:hypothetical protein